MERFLFIINSPDFFLSHRLPIAKAIQNSGIEVHIATGDGLNVSEIHNLGFTHHLLPISRSGFNLIAELKIILALWHLIRETKPDLLHLVTIKPVLYGGLLARFCRVPAVVAAISGLGSVFSPYSSVKKVSLIRYVIKLFYIFALKHPNLRVIFQNTSDQDFLIRLGAIRSDQAALIRGSGVNLSDYPVKPEPKGDLVVTFAARLLKEKGVLEFIESARLLKKRGRVIRFWVVGSPDIGNPSSIREEDLIHLNESKIFEYLGFRDDIAEIFSRSNIVVLPSYYGEGLPKVLIEAASCGRAVVTTDLPGCRDAIISNVSGMLVPPRDVNKLADAIESLALNSTLRLSMGEAGRQLAENTFGIEKVVDKHLLIYSQLTGLWFKDF